MKTERELLETILKKVDNLEKEFNQFKSLKIVDNELESYQKIKKEFKELKSIDRLIDYNSEKELDIFIKSNYNISFRDTLNYKQYSRHLDKLNQKSILYLLNHELNELELESVLKDKTDYLSQKFYREEKFFYTPRFDLLYEHLSNKSSISAILPNDLQYLKNRKLYNLIQEHRPMEYKKQVEKNIKNKYYSLRANVIENIIFFSLVGSFLYLISMLVIEPSWLTYFRSLGACQFFSLLFSCITTYKGKRKFLYNKELQKMISIDKKNKTVSLNNDVDIKSIDYKKMMG